MLCTAIPKTAIILICVLYATLQSLSNKYFFMMKASNKDCLYLCSCYTAKLSSAFIFNSNFRK